jgi:GNAT superfamily N-acetyltransferase
LAVPPLVTRIEVVRSYVELQTLGQLRGTAEPPAGFTIGLADPCPVELYRFLYSEVGRRYHWVDRLQWSDEQIQRHLARPGLTIWLMRQDQKIAGYFELERHDDGSIEISYLGLLDPFVGRGLGKYLLTVAAHQALAMDANRVWLHTCTLDHPAALPNYLARGFRQFKTETYSVELGADRD